MTTRLFGWTVHLSVVLPRILPVVHRRVVDLEGNHNMMVFSLRNGAISWRMEPEPAGEYSSMDFWVGYVHVTAERFVPLDPEVAQQMLALHHTAIAQNTTPSALLAKAAKEQG